MSLVDHITNDDVREIKMTKFGVLSPEKIIAQSVAHIYNHIGKQKDNSNTLLDPRLGASRGQVNAITGLSQKFDPGNFGHCILAKPVYHPMFFDPYIKRIVSSVCIVCSCPRYSNDKEKEEFARDVKSKTNMMRFAHVTGKLSGRDNKNCIRCGNLLPAIRENKSTFIVMGLQAIFGKDKDNQKDLNPEHVYRILKNITDEDCELMGLDPKTARPDWMMITVLPVPPPSIRPSVQVENGKVSEDDLTHAFNSIIKQNNALNLMLEKRDREGEKSVNDNVINKLWQALQLVVACMIDNETTSYPTATNRTHRPLKTIRKRHRGKQGRIRGNLMGKRVNVSARSVITADPNLSINQVGVPLRIAMNLTYPEVVTRYNIDRLNRLVKNGPHQYPGAKHYRAKHSKFRKDLSVDQEITLCYGDIVYRHMLDGDIVFFNRQPSLHKMSMMAHYAKVMPGLSFRLNPNVTTPYNADFDGDEMNLHLPQSVITAEEISRLAMVSTQIVSPQAYKPIIGLVQDSLLGIYRMSSEHVRGFKKEQVYYMNPRQFMRLAVWLNNYVGKMPAPLKFDKDGKMGWTTRQLLNMFMPHVSMKSGGLSIKNGVIAEPAAGTEAVPMGKKVVGKGAGGGLIHISWNDLGPSATRDLLDNFSRLSSQWLLIDGFSVGLSDVEIMASVLADVERIKNEYMDGARELIEGLHLGKYDETRDRIIKQPRGLAKNDYEQFEVDIMYHLGDCKSKIEKLTVDNLTSVHADNRIRSMVDSGSKGSSANVVQIAAALGQQDIGGKRIANSYTRRPFPHVPKDDLSPETRGFCRNCFIAGLSPIEYITHAMAGRIGVISTSIKTAETGYIQRKLVKVLEDVMVMYDGTVRNAAYMIIQHLYGGDGFDGAKIEPQRLDHLTMANDEFAVTFKYSDADVEDLKIMMSDEAYARFDSERVAQLAAIAEETKRVEEDRKVVRSLYKHNIPEHFLSPVNFARIIKHTSFRLGIKANVPSDLTPKEIITEVNNTINSLRVSENGRINEVCTRNIRALMRSYLHSKKLLFAEKFTREALVYLLTSIKVKFNDALISPGEAVGPIAAQSIGEPSTQMSCIGSEKLIILDNGTMKQVKIGEFVDKLMKDDISSVIDLGSDSSELRTNELYIHSVDPATEVAHWSKVRSVSRHPANGGLIRIKTAAGRETTTTLSHSHLKRDSASGIVPVKGSELKVGDRVPVALELPTIDNPLAEIEHNGTKFKMTPLMGWLLGAYTAEGCINGAQVHISNVSDEYEENVKAFCTEYGCTYRVQICNGEYGPSKTLAIKGGCQLADFVGDSCGRGSFNKKVADFMYGTELSVIAAYIRGAMDGDGNIMGAKSHETVRYGSRSKELVNGMVILFSYFGIFASILEEENKGGKPFYWAIVLRKHIKKYRDMIGVDIASKKKKLEDAVAGIAAPKKTEHEYIDMIPLDKTLATAIAESASKLCMDGASRTYGRWLRQKKTEIGRNTLSKYAREIEDAAKERPRIDVSAQLDLICRARDSGVLWDEITELEILEDPKEYVYDLTVPGTESFMVANGLFVHNTLDTFHHAGIGAKANVSRGVPRLKEIMSLAVKPKTPAIITYLNPNVIRHLRVGSKTIEALDAELRAAYMSANLTDKAAKEALKHTKEDMQQGIIKAVKKIKSEYDYVTFKDIVRKIEVVYDENDEDTVIEEDQGFLRAYWEVCKATTGEDMAGSPWVLRFELDSHKLADHNIELYQIEYAFNSDPMIRNKIQCIFSDDNAQKVVCRARITDVGSNPTMIIDALEGSLLSKKIKGVPGISKTSIRIEKADIRTDAGAIISQYDSEYSDATLSTVASEEYVIDTVGSNLLEILNMPYVDATRTVSNNIYEIFDVYGVEGARQVIINEIMEVMEYAGASVGRRHVELLADIMTSRGILQSVDRFGVKKGETGPWARASFEETTPHMVQAAAFSEIDNMKGVSANVMFGQFPRVGTNSFTVGLDEAMISKLEAIKEEEEFDIDVTVANAADDIALCDKENFEFNFSL